MDSCKSVFYHRVHRVETTETGFENYPPTSRSRKNRDREVGSLLKQRMIWWKISGYPTSDFCQRGIMCKTSATFLAFAIVQKNVLLFAFLLPATMKIKPLRACYPNLDLIESLDVFCDEAKNLYRNYVDQGLYKKVPERAVFIYQIQSVTGEHTGLVALNEVEDFFDGKVKKHEATLSEREKQQMNLFLRWDAILKPVLLTYPTVPSIRAWLNGFVQKSKPLFVAKFKQGRVQHRVWPVTDEHAIAELQTLFAQHVKSTYIADGHHRTTTMAMLHEQREQYPDYDFDHLFCAFFATDQLDILDYNRAVEIPKTITTAQFVAYISKVFDIEVLDAARHPTAKHELVMCLRKEWYSLRWRPKILRDRGEQNDLLDASLLNELVLENILGIHDVRSDARVTYIDGSKGMEGLRKAATGRNRVGFALFPVHFADMMFLADAGEILPPKSTYFEPRLKSGMLVQLLRKQD